MTARKLQLLMISAVLTALAGAACGVKGPPLPPVSATPQQSDLRASPVPAPSARGAAS